MSRGQRRLAAIMFTDLVGYTSLSQKDEAFALELLEEHRRVIRSLLTKHKGREVKTMGDGSLSEFESALDAVKCAFDIQRSIHELNVGREANRQIPLRVGIHLGDVVHSERDVYGDAVNLASRIEPLASPGGICVTEQVYAQVKNKFEAPMVSIGNRQLKNVDEPLEVYRVMLPWEQQDRKGQGLDTKRLAVLPFTSLSSDPNDAFFADGVTEEIISAASGISGLEVISRTSVVGYKGTAKRIREIGEELDVGSILEGSFRKAGTRIRVTAQLIDVEGDKHLWAQSYDKELDDVFAVQTDIAKQVAEALRVRILAPEMGRLERKPTESTKAYVSYLRGRHHWSRRNLDDLNRALQYFQQAVDDDPNFALGYAGIADCYAIIAGNIGTDAEANYARARAMLSKALELEPDLAEARATKGLMLYHEFDLRGAEAELKRAVELKPSYATAHQWHALVLAALSRPGDAGKEIETAVELDPLSPIINSNLGDHYFHVRDYPRALEAAKRAAELNPGRFFSHFQLAIRYGVMGMMDDAEREKEIAVRAGREEMPSVEVVLEVVLARFRGDKGKVRRLLPEMERYSGTPIGPAPSIIASHYFWLGEKERGFEWLERAYAAKDEMMLIYKDDWFFDTIREDKRFVDFFRKIVTS